MVLANQRPLLFVFVSNPGVIAVFHLFEVNNYWTFEQVKFYFPQIYECQGEGNVDTNKLE